MDALEKRGNLTDIIRRSPPLDVTAPFDETLVKDKTILITGGASGFGEGFFRRWADNGANVIIGDVNRGGGKALVDEVREKTGNSNHHFIYCDVTNWQSQVDFFHEAIKLSPHGGIDAVVANAGIVETPSTFEKPRDLDADEPRPPNLKCLDVNLIGVLYTTHLALYYLPRNPGSDKASPSTVPGKSPRDRHILLIGSVASVFPIPAQIIYGISKHAVLGLFRQLVGSSFIHGIRVNILCPYFIDTPLIDTPGRVILAGGGMGKPEDVVEAGTRFMADSSIAGRALVVGPRLKIDENMQLITDQSVEGTETALYEIYAHDYEQVETFVGRLVRLLNQLEVSRGWAGWFIDIGRAFFGPSQKKK
ncbi:short chain dehydrogenase/reductase-like protein [Xylogone sp. PMI_703]|nr:short chain dehydrogenase/reductase-like protein [Xylogone sp. PMI_703]